MRCSHSNCLLRIPRVVDSQCETLSRITRRDHNRDTLLYQSVHFDTNRTLAARKPLCIEIIAQAEIHPMDNNFASVAVDLLDVLECGNGVAYRIARLARNDLVANELALRSHAHHRRHVLLSEGHLACRIALLHDGARRISDAGFTSDAARYVRAVPGVMS